MKTNKKLTMIILKHKGVRINPGGFKQGLIYVNRHLVLKCSLGVKGYEHSLLVLKSQINYTFYKT